MPCLEAGGNTTLHYTLVTSMPQLCAPAPGSRVSHAIYTGAVCGASGSKQIQWAGAHTVDPRPGLAPSECTWDFAAGSNYTGTCGGCAAWVRLPTEIC